MVRIEMDIDIMIESVLQCLRHGLSFHLCVSRDAFNLRYVYIFQFLHVVDIVPFFIKKNKINK